MMNRLGEFSDGAHRISYHVYYDDTDAGGIVYHANYLKFAERARTDALRLLGYSQHALAQEEGVIFVVTHADISFRRPARLDDMITVESRLIDVQKMRMTMEQTLLKADEHLTTMRIRLAAINRESRAVRLPERLMAALEPMTTIASKQEEYLLREGD